MARLANRAVCCACLLVCAACTPPPDQPTEKPTEPRATALREAVHAPLESAQAAQRHVEDAAARQTGTIDAEGG
ncbi:hypothetical protein CMZ84_03490 [Lysobacteraceae bacterium NML93-0399]|nr:hypothetical protein CMZ84_03490 [Xanthomonadaceae bacterium NML93-0399]